MNVDLQLGRSLWGYARELVAYAQSRGYNIDVREGEGVLRRNFYFFGDPIPVLTVERLLFKRADALTA